MQRLLELLPAFVVTLATVPFWVALGRRQGLIDEPLGRSTHAAPVARVGGLAMAGGLLAGLIVLGLRGHALLDAAAGWWPYLIPAVLFFAIGILDDVGRASTGRKFLMQASAAAVAVLLGLRWEGVALGPFGTLAFGAATPGMTGLWIVAVVTLVNLLDGLDLITGATCAVVLAACAGFGAGPGDGLLYGLALAVVLGFVPWNVKPAVTFPGDAGTHLLGFLVATAPLSLPGRTQALPWVLASAPLLPGVIDLALGLVAKKRRGVPFTQAHNQHLSQRLTHLGWPHAFVATRYGALAVVALLLTGVVAPRWGLLPCVGLAALVLLWHLGGGLWSTRKIPHSY